MSFVRFDRKRFSWPARLLILVLVGVLFSSCRPIASGPMGPGAGTPEAAALQTIIRAPGPMPNFQIDPNSVSVRQSVPFNDRFLVMIAFTGTQLGNDAMPGPQKCLFTYEVLRTRLGGWATGSGGGGCTSGNPEGRSEPLSIGASTHGGNGLGDQGFSTVDGEVNQTDIVNVLVRWDDNQVQNVPVMNGTFIAARQGQHNMSKVDGLNEAGQVVYSTEPFVAPGKQ